MQLDTRVRGTFGWTSHEGGSKGWVRGAKQHKAGKGAFGPIFGMQRGLIFKAQRADGVGDCCEA